MKKFKILVGAGVMLLGMVGAAQAVTINYLWAPDGPNNYTSPYAGVTVQNFDSTALGALPAGWVGDGQVVVDSVGGQYAAPHGQLTPDLTNYLTVPNTTDQTFTNFLDVTFSQTYNYFGLWWGSVDTYNTLSFFLGGLQTGVFDGTSISSPNPANGNQTAPATNLYVNFLGLSFDRVRIASSQNAFEVDNVAYGNVPIPEPSTLLLLGAGLLGLAGVSRRRLKK